MSPNVRSRAFSQEGLFVIDEYVLSVKALSKSDSPEIIDNCSIEHATTLLSEMFSKAVKTVRIFTMSFDSALFCRESVVASARSFLAENSEATIDVVVQVENGVNHFNNFVNLVVDSNEDFGKRVRFGQVKGTLSAIQTNFVLFDEKAFRYVKDRSKFEAIASFNQPSLVTELGTTFKMLINSIGTPLKTKSEFVS